MQDNEFYRYLLGIQEPWEVESVKLDLVNQRLDVWANHPEGLRWPCPECGVLVRLYDHALDGSGDIWIVASSRRFFMPGGCG